MNKKDFILSNLTTRPPRIVFLLNKDIPDWKKSVLDIIEMYSEIWGGMYNLIVPYSTEDIKITDDISGDKLKIEKVFIDILKVYDADYYLLYEDFNWKDFYYWLKVYSQLKPFLDKNKLSYLSTYYIESKQKFRNIFEKQIIPLNFIEERLEKYEIDSFVNYKHEKELTTIDLIMYSQIGKFNKEKYENRLPLTTSSPPNISTFFFEGIEDDIHYAIGELFGEYPFYTTLIDTHIYEIQNCKYKFTDIVIFDEEESIENFLLYYNLLRINIGKTIYINNSILKSNLFNLREELRNSEVIFSNKSEKSEITAKNLEINKLNIRKIYSETYQFLSKIEGNRIFINFSPDLSKYYKELYPIFTFNFENYLLPNSFIRNFSEDIRSSVEGFHSEQLLYNFPYLDAFSIFKDILKKNRDLYYEIIPNSESITNIELKISDKGMYFNYIYNDIFNGNFEKLKNFFLNDSQILLLYFIKLSLKEKEKNKEEKNRFIKKVSFLMEKFNIDEKGFSEYLERVKLGRVHNRRSYFIYEDLEKFYRKLGIRNYVEIIDNLLQKDILERGYILKCKYCSNTEFYYFNEILEDSNFKCKRCSLKQKILKDNMSTPNSIDLKVVYKLNEVIFQYIDNNGLVPLFTLFKLKNIAKRSFLFSPEFEIVAFRGDKMKKIIEIDIASIVDGSIVMGECKRDLDNFSNWDVNNFKSFIDAFKPDKVIFSTFDRKFPTEKTTIKKLLDSLQSYNLEVIEFNKSKFLESI